MESSLLENSCWVKRDIGNMQIKRSLVCPVLMDESWMNERLTFYSLTRTPSFSGDFPINLEYGGYFTQTWVRCRALSIYIHKRLHVSFASRPFDSNCVFKLPCPWKLPKTNWFVLANVKLYSHMFLAESVLILFCFIQPEFRNYAHSTDHTSVTCNSVRLEDSTHVYVIWNTRMYWWRSSHDSIWFETHMDKFESCQAQTKCSSQGESSSMVYGIN